MGQIGPRLEKISPIQGFFSDNSAQTLTWFKVTTAERPQSGALTKWTYYTTDEIWAYDVYQKQFWYIWKTKMPELTKYISTEKLKECLCIRMNIKVYF